MLSPLRLLKTFQDELPSLLSSTNYLENDAKILKIDEEFKMIFKEQEQKY